MGDETKVEEQTILAEMPKETVTPEETVDSLKAQLADLKTKYEQTEKGLRTAHQTLTEKDKLIKNREDYENRIAGVEDRIELLATAIAMGKTDETEVNPEQKQDVLKAIQQKRVEQDAKRRQKEAEEIVNGYRQRVEALGLSEDTEEYYEIKELVETFTPNSLKRADIRLKKLESVKESKEKEVTKETTKPVEDVEAVIAKRLQEEKKKWMQENNILETEVGFPSTRSSSFKELEAKYANGEISLDAYNKARKAEGL